MVARDIERNIMDYHVGSNLTKPHRDIPTYLVELVLFSPIWV